MDISDEPQTPDPEELQSLRVRRDSPSTGSRDAFMDLLRLLVTAIEADSAWQAGEIETAQLRSLASKRLDAVLEATGLVLNRGERRQLLEAIIAELVAQEKKASAE